MAALLMTYAQWHRDRWLDAARARFDAAISVASPPLLTSTEQAPTVLVVDGLVYAAWLTADGLLALQPDGEPAEHFDYTRPGA